MTGVQTCALPISILTSYVHEGGQMPAMLKRLATLEEAAGKPDQSAATLERPEVAELIDAAVAQAKPLPESGGGKLIIQSISAKQRSRR